MKIKEYFATMTENQRLVLAMLVLVTICLFCCIVLKGSAVQ